MSSVRFNLSRTVPILKVTEDAKVWAMTITCTTVDPEGDPAIFVYQTASNETDDDLFFDVADSRDMATLPAEDNEPNPDLTDTAIPPFNNIPFYRVNKAVFNCYNASEMERIWKMIKYKAQNLAWELNAIDRPEWQETDFETV